MSRMVAILAVLIVGTACGDSPDRPISTDDVDHLAHVGGHARG